MATLRLGAERRWVCKCSGSRMTAGLTDRSGISFGKWQDRFVDWFRDTGFMQKPGVETKAAKDIQAFVSQPLPGSRQRPGGTGATNSPVKTAVSQH